MLKHFEKYPLYLRAKDVADALQVSDSTARKMMRLSGYQVAVGATGKVKRVPRDKFFQWIIELEGKKAGEGA